MLDLDLNSSGQEYGYSHKGSMFNSDPLPPFLEPHKSIHRLYQEENIMQVKMKLLQIN